MHKLREQIIEHELSNVMRLEKQLTDEECEKLIARFEKNLIWKVLLKMDNYRPLAKKSRSVYRTIINWIEREPQVKKELQPDQLFTYERAYGWMHYMKLSATDFEVYFDVHAKDEKTGKTLYRKRL